VHRKKNKTFWPLKRGKKKKKRAEREKPSENWKRATERGRKKSLKGEAGCVRRRSGRFRGRSIGGGRDLSAEGGRSCWEYCDKRKSRFTEK